MSFFRDISESEKFQSKYLFKFFGNKELMDLDLYQKTFYSLYEGINQTKKYTHSTQREFILNYLEPYDKKIKNESNDKEINKIVKNVEKIQNKIFNLQINSKKNYKDFLKIVKKSLKCSFKNVRFCEDCYLYCLKYSQSKNYIIEEINFMGDNLVNLMNFLEKRENLLCKENLKLFENFQSYLVQHVGGIQSNFMSKIMSELENVRLYINFFRKKLN